MASGSRMDLYEHDRLFLEKGFKLIAGMDEAGRGPLAGPVVAAAVVLDPGDRIDGVNDSKKLSDAARRFLFMEILCRASHIGIGVVGADVIDSINILNATKMAMEIAFGDLPIAPDIVLIDALTIPSINVKQIPIIRGDAASAAIAAASIVAKVTRDMLMEQCHREYPLYGFNSHKGYGTRAHMEKIKKFGPCGIHRKTFRPVSDFFPLATEFSLF
jgi:ribonuclease HII